VQWLCCCDLGYINGLITADLHSTHLYSSYYSIAHSLVHTLVHTVSLSNQNNKINCSSVPAVQVSD
jgi:hypothetical protein